MTFSSSQVPRAEQLNAMLRQTIQPYASSAARDTALAAVLKEGMLTYLEDTNTLTMYDGAAWVTVALTGSVDAGSLIGATLAAGVTASSLTSVGTLASLDVAGQLRTGAGTVALPSHSFTSDPDTGMYRSAANELSIATTGVARMTIDSAGEVTLGHQLNIMPGNTAGGFELGQWPANNDYMSIRVGDMAQTTDYVLLTGIGGDSSTYLGSATGGSTNIRGPANSATAELKVSGTASSFTGNVGIGTTTPAAGLHVEGISTPEIRITSTDATDTRIVFGDHIDGVQASITYDLSVQKLQLRGHDNTTAMTIDSAGYVGIGDTSPQSQIDVKSTTARAYHFHRKAAVGVSGGVVGGIVQIGDDGDATNPDTSDYWMLFRRGNGSTLGSVRGTAGASVNFLATSDATLKTDNGLVDEGRVGSIIDALQIHDFDWNEGTVTNQIGVFAQEAIDVLPESIVAAPGEDEDGNYMPAGLDYSKIVPILIAECQFLRQRVAALEAT